MVRFFFFLSLRHFPFKFRGGYDSYSLFNTIIKGGLINNNTDGTIFLYNFK